MTVGGRESARARGQPGVTRRRAQRAGARTDHHLHALEELAAVEHAVGDALFGERRLQHARVGVETEEDAKVGPRQAERAAHALDLLGDVVDLGLAVGEPGARTERERNVSFRSRGRGGGVRSREGTHSRWTGTVHEPRIEIRRFLMRSSSFSMTAVPYVRMLPVDR